MDFLFLITDIIFLDKIEAVLINSLVVILQYNMLILPNEYIKGGVGRPENKSILM